MRKKNSKMMKLKKMADKGDVISQNALAVSYAIGDEVDTDMKEARYWYSRAADQDDPDAMFNLAAMYLKGEGGAKSYKKAKSLFKKASDFGSGDATVWLGEEALTGKFYEDAYKFFALAAIQGDSRGIRGISCLLQLSNDHVVKKGGVIIQRQLKKSGIAF